jgi:ribokinase
VDDANQRTKAASQALGRSLDPGMLKPEGEILVTLGAEGCRRISGDGMLDVPGLTIDTIDTTGAGDCFAGAYLAWKLGGSPVLDSLHFANAAAALTTLGHGTQVSMPRRAAAELLFSSGRIDAGKTIQSRLMAR